MTEKSKKNEKHTDGTSQGDVADPAVMADPRYLRQSSTLINEALQKGFDVLQLANGDIVTTGTKIVVTTYTWDEEKGKLVKSRSGRRRAVRAAVEQEMAD